jgi:hypothetical protein
MARTGPSVAILLLHFSVVACVDLTPVTLEGNDAALVNDGSAPNECEVCLYGPQGQAGCGEQLAACNADAKCPAIMRCLFDKDCTRYDDDETVNRCSLPCVLATGVTSPSDPGVVNAVALSNCSAGPCPNSCYAEPLAR